MTPLQLSKKVSRHWYIPTASPTVCFRRQIPTTFETELVPSLKITDGKYMSVIPLVLSDFLVVLRYLRGTTSHGLHITRSSSFALHGFTDADWAGSVEDRKSTGGYLVFFGQTPISWKSGKQRIVARSSTEDEYKALTDGTTEVIWLQYLLTDLQFPSASAPII